MIKVQLEIGKKVYENEENWQMADNENQIRKNDRKWKSN
mgnify:CR=1 FL=1